MVCRFYIHFFIIFLIYKETNFFQIFKMKNIPMENNKFKLQSLSTHVCEY